MIFCPQHRIMCSECKISCFGMFFRGLYGENAPKVSKKSEKTKIHFFDGYKLYLVVLEKILGQKHQQRKSIIIKTFGIFCENLMFQDNFWLEPRDSMTKNPGFHGFSEIRPTSKSPKKYFY